MRKNRMSPADGAVEQWWWRCWVVALVSRGANHRMLALWSYPLGGVAEKSHCIYNVALGIYNDSHCIKFNMVYTMLPLGREQHMLASARWSC